MTKEEHKAYKLYLRQRREEVRQMAHCYDGYFSISPTERRKMKVADKVKILDYQPGAFALEVLDTRQRNTSLTRDDNWTHKR